MRIALLISAACLLAGCATTGNMVGSKPSGPTPKLSSAVELMQKGETAAAKRMFAAISKAPAVPGVTDEALFRLALISLKPSVDRDGSAYRLLRRLKREFPGSPWTAQAEPLLEFIDGAEEMRRQNRQMKGTNQGLVKENEELKKGAEQMKQSIEQMKHLDLELEKQNR